MMSVLLWKEYREHRMVWTALAFLGAATIFSRPILVGAGLIDPHSEARQLVLAISVMLVGVYALICGAMMLAGERENGTLPYLDALPGFRRRVWQGKFVAGVLLVLGQIVLLMTLCAAVSLFENGSEAWWTFGGMVWAGLFGLSWGMLFSSVGRNVTNVILLSVAGYVALGLVAAILAVISAGLMMALFGREPHGEAGLLWIGLYAVITPAALIGSALVFTQLDRKRLRALPESLRVQGRALHPTWSMLFWLTWRQALGFAAGLAVFALLLGFLLPVQGLILWPIATLVIGVLCGATAFSDEQQGPFRFLGDQRFPLGRLWTVKVGVRFAVAVVAALLVLAPSFIAALYNIPGTRWDNPQGPYYFIAHVFHSDLLVNMCPPGLFLTLWLVYGFSAGCLFGLLFRNGLAAGVFALFACSLTAAFWIPSLLDGGLHAWQVSGPPVLILIASRLLMRPWAAGRIASWTTAARLTPFVALAGLWIAGGLWYRVLEIPNVSPKIDLAAFRARLPEQDEGGRLFHSACLRFNDLRHELESQEMPMGGAMGAVMPGAPGLPPLGVAAPAAIPGPVGMAAPGGAPGMPPPAPAPMEPPPSPLMERARDALAHGWPAKDHDLAVWMDKMYAGEWMTTLKQAAGLPTSPFDDVRNMTFLEGLPASDSSGNVAVVLAVRGLQRQAAGDDEAYVENLRIGLALSRSLRDRTPAVDLIFARAVEGTLLTGLDRWLEKLHGKPDLIRQALALLSRHLDETVDEGKDIEAITALIGKNTLDNPLSTLERYLNYEGDRSGQRILATREEAVLIATAWLVPWEHARLERIFRVTYFGDQTQQGWLAGRVNELGLPLQSGPYDHLLNLEELRSLRNKPGELCDARVMQLKLALRWCQADAGRPAENLEELVPKYLPSIPINPYDGEPFRYRLSRGEEIALPERKIPPGQGVLSSAGEDRIFIVPLPPKAK